MRIVVFVCATDSEFEAMKNMAESREEFVPVTIYKDMYKYNDMHILLYKAGITYFNSMRLVDAVLKYMPDAVYNVGSCAGLCGQDLYTVIASNNCYCNDLDLTAFGEELGTLSGKKIFGDYGPVIVSGSKFLDSTDEIKKVKSKFNNPVAFDMESFMFKRICDEFAIPFLSVRGVSDGGDENAKVSFEESVRNATRSAFVYALGLESEEPLRERLGEVKENGSV